MRQTWSGVAMGIALGILSAHGQTDVFASKATVVSQAGATAAEVHAAKELRDHLSKITGTEVKLVSNASEAKGTAIVVGQGPIARKLFPKVNWERLGGEQTLIKTKGSALLVAGGRPRGTLYAVYRLLGEKCGIRWWTPWATTIPRNPKLAFCNLDWSETPLFEYRDAFWFHAFDADWAVRNGCNGFNVHTDEARGGRVEYQGFVHTYNGLVPPDKLFAAHPEWYSLINGKRTAENSQLCTTNTEMREHLVEQVRSWLRSNPRARIVSVSQNDCFNPCQCAPCRALAEGEGSDAALVLDLANFVGQRIEREFPNVAVDTLAYQWSRHPTKTMKPRPNVIVRLCSIECNFAFPLDASENAAFGDDIRGWSKHTNRLYVWNYCTDFAHYLQPHPDYFTIVPTVRFFAQNGVKGVFEQGAYQSNGGDMAELKAWVTARVLWDPAQDSNRLIDEFLRGYYGAAGRTVRRILDLLATEAKGWNLTFASPVSASFLRYEVVRRALLLWQQASREVANAPELAWRVRKSEASVGYVWLSRWSEFRREALKQGDPWPVPTSRKAFAEAWLHALLAPPPGGGPGWSPPTHVNEGGLSPQAFVERLGPDPPE